MAPDWEHIRKLVTSHLDEIAEDLQAVNQSIHSQPELAFKEFHARHVICSFLEKQGFAVQRGAYGLNTSFEATMGSGGRLVIICAEYDALPDIGHGCGHNLIATSSLGAFVGAAHVLGRQSTEAMGGRVRILGTPAEEGGGGKVKLIRAGAFRPAEDIAASIMAHPVPDGGGGLGGVSGIAALDLVASFKFKVEFTGRPAHAANSPWAGRNALDAAVGAYTGVSMLRQQIRPEERVHGVIEVGGTVPNIVPAYTRMNWYVRAPTTVQGETLQTRVHACIDAGAAAADCSRLYLPADTYKHVISNRSLCNTYIKDMGDLGERVIAKPPRPFSASTDMGNVTHEVPGFHGGFAVPTAPDVSLHTAEFATASGTPEAHACAMKCAAGLAMLALRVVMDDQLAADVRRDFSKGVPV